MTNQKARTVQLFGAVTWDIKNLCCDAIVDMLPASSLPSTLTALRSNSLSGSTKLPD